MDRALKIDAVLSVACKKDLAVWSLAAPRILRFINADRYILIVPDEEVELFKESSPSAFAVIPETPLLPTAKVKLTTRLAGTPAEERVGWYLQQLLKLSACASVQGERLLIWDADTIPLRPLEFFAAGDNPVYYPRRHYKTGYFLTVKKLLGLEKQVAFSFVSQCFPIRKTWLVEFFHEIEGRFGTPWIDAIIASIDPNEHMSFSEYETLGTFFASRHRSSIMVHDGKWLRYGNRLLSETALLDDKTESLLSSVYDFVSFETWDWSRFTKLRFLAFKIHAFIRVKIFTKRAQGSCALAKRLIHKYRR